MELQITQTRHPKSVADGRMNGWSGPTTTPAFCQINIELDDSKQIIF